MSNKNRLLASLPRDDYARLSAHLEPVDLEYRLVLYAANHPIEFVHFIETGVGSLVMPAHVFSELLEQHSAIRTAMLHYAQAFFNQVAQSAACALHHSLERRCCRWLLMTHDRMDSDEFLLTHEFLAMMLGVRRAGVTVAMQALKRAALIEYQRKHVTILDRAGLEKRSCECYAVTKKEFDRLLGVKKTDVVSNRKTPRFQNPKVAV